MSSYSSNTISILLKIWVTLILIRVVSLCPLYSHSRKFLVTPWWFGVTQALDWGLCLNPDSWPTCPFSLWSSCVGRGPSDGTLVLCGYRQHENNWLKPFGSRTGGCSGAQLTEAAKPQSEALTCCQFACPQYEKVTYSLAVVTAPFFTSPS